MSKKYWSEEQDELVVRYISTEEQSERNKVYTKLRPAIVKMTEGLLIRYFKIYSNDPLFKDLVHEAETFLILRNVISKFNPLRAKPYSFLGTCLKHFIGDRLKRGDKLKTISLDFLIEQEIDFEAPVMRDEKGYNDEMFNLKNEAVEKINMIIENSDDRDKSDFFKQLLHFIENENDYDAYWLSHKLYQMGYTDFLMKKYLEQGRIFNLIKSPKALKRIISNYCLANNITDESD